MTNYDTEHIPAPSEHAPRKEAMQEEMPDSDKIAVMEEDNDDAWITAENPVEVKR